MTTIKDGPQMPASPTYEITTAPQPKVWHWVWWHYVAIGLGLAIVAPLTFIGANTVGHHYLDPPLTAAAKATAITLNQTPRQHKTQPPRPVYNLAGYQSAISGPEAQAFTTALNTFRADSKRYNFQAVTRDSLALTDAANTWLAMLKATSPPPGYQVSKLDYVLAATLAQQAATVTQGAIQSADLGALQAGARLAAKAKAALARAAANAPHGS